MRLATWVFLVLVLGVVMGIARDEVGRVAVIVFVAGAAITAAGLTISLALFQTVAALGEARGVAAHLEAAVATAVVLAVGSALIVGLFFAAALGVDWAVP
ncbi:hypothetical protein TA3x_000852 [Tundrisphaera sp. TA3]|uniref:hypothetical protein n=1 Tax=Tundrisphaera sp. TA3 TaxID=3435775 RepID=UPI003EBD48E7